MSEDLTTGIVRILTADDTTAGTGFVVTDDGLIATCAHVVQGAGAGPGDIVRVAFHATGEEREALVEPAWWRDPDAEDVAILRLERPLPEGVTPLALSAAAGSTGHPFRAFGYPVVGDIEGLWATGEIKGLVRDAQGRQMLQLASAEIDRGISGGPVLDKTRRRVVGMVTATYYPDGTTKHRDTGFAPPTETLQVVCPELQLSDLCPYRGLAAFTEADAEFFFGRDALVADLVDHLRGNPRFLAVVGPSGSGKSSVVHAGLFPALRRGEVSGSEEWHLLTFRPGTNPFAALAAAGLDTLQRGDLQTCRPADLQTCDLQAAVRAFLKAHPQIKRLVLFADQFEELFTLCPQLTQEQFMRQLPTLLEGNLPITVVLTLRADFYGHLLRHRPLVDWLKIGQVNVPPMGAEELRAAVGEPTTKLGLRFESGLVETIVEEAGAADHPLPLLESALTQLWEKREDGMLTHAAYQAVGQVAGAIGQWAEDAYTELVPEERLLAQRVFTRLVRYGEGEVADTRQRQSLSKLVTRPEEQEPLHQLVQRLADARLLVTGRDPGTDTVEIIHDELLQQWSRLKHWTAEQREFYLWRQRLDERLQEWEEKGQDEGALLRGALLAEAERWLTEWSDDLNSDERMYIRESAALHAREQAAREQLRQRIILGLAAGLVVTVVLTLLAWRQRNVALDAQATAQAESSIAFSRELATVAMGQLEVDPEVSILLALEAVRVAHTFEAEDALRRALLTSYVRAVLRGQGLTGSATFSTNGEQVLTVDQLSGIVRVWEAITGDELAVLQGHKVTNNEGVRATFSPDGQWVLTVDASHAARMWEVSTGQEVMVLHEHEGDIEKAIFSPDGWWVLAASNDGAVWVWEVATGQNIAVLRGHEATVELMAFSPDGQQLVTASSMDNTARVWQMTTGQEIAVLRGHESQSPYLEGGVWSYAGVPPPGINSVMFSPDGKLVVTAGNDGTARIWEAATGQERVKLGGHSSVVSLAAFSPDGKWVLTVDGIAARVWEANTGEMLSTLYGAETTISWAEFGSDGQWVLTTGGGTAQVWDATTGRMLSVLRVYGEEIWSAAFSPDGKQLVTRGPSNVVRVWEATTGREITVLRGHRSMGMVISAIFSPDGRYVLTSGQWDGTARVWEIDNVEVAVLRGHEYGVSSAVFSPDGQWVLTGGGADMTARVWAAATGREENALRGHENTIRTAAFSPNGQWAVTASADRTARVWDVITGQEVLVLRGHEDDVNEAIFSPNGELIVTVSDDHTVRVWGAATGREIAVLRGHNDRVVSASFSPDGRLLVTTDWSDATARVWEVATWKEVNVLRGHEGWITSASFSPDGQLLLTANYSVYWPDGPNIARIREAATGQELAVLRGHSDGIWSAVFSLDGQRVVTASEDGTARVWDSTTGETLVVLRGHEDTVWTAVFSSDGQRIVTASQDGTARIWDATTGETLAVLRGHEDAIKSATFSPNGRWVATASVDGTARIYATSIEDLLALAQQRVTRTLTCVERVQYLHEQLDCGAGTP